MKTIYILIILTLVSCSNQSSRPIGIKDFDELMSIAKKVQATGDHKLLLKHTDLSGIPEKNRKQILSTLESWTGMNPDMKIRNIEIVKAKDYDPYFMIPDEWDDDYKARFNMNLKPLTWNIEPEKYIVFFEETKSEKDGALNRTTFGIFKRNGLWYFAASYLE